MKKPLRVFIVDDHDLVRSGIRHMLEEGGLLVVGEADSGEKALEILCSADRNLPVNANAQFVVDVILLDVQMPGIGGIETARKLLRLRPDIKILVISVCSDSIFPSLLLKAGVHGYMTKGASQDEMIEAIQRIVEGERYLSFKIALAVALKQIDHGSKAMLDVLSEREKQIAIMISEGGRARDIGRKLRLSTKTVNSYRYRIFEKLHIKNDIELLNFFEMSRRIHAGGLADKEDAKEKKVAKAQYSQKCEHCKLKKEQENKKLKQSHKEVRKSSTPKKKIRKN